MNALLLSMLIFLSTPMHRATLVEGGGHFPVLIRLRNDDLLGVVRGGAAHRGQAGRVDLLRSADGGKTWSGPTVLVDGPTDDRNPGLGQLADGSIIAAFTIITWEYATGGEPKKTGQRCEGVHIMRSADNGKTWSTPVRSEGIAALYTREAGDGMSGSPYGKIVQLADGTALMAVYFGFPGERGQESWLFRSTDNGATWGDPTRLGEHFNETGIIALRDGRVLAAMRAEVGRHLALIESSDGGRTWSEPVQITADHEHPADLIELADGRLLLTYGQRNTPRGVEAILSADGGRTWDPKTRVKLAEETKYGDNGYPSSVQLGDGSIVTMYYQVDHPEGALVGAKTKLVRWAPPQADSPLP
jgi:sialidase-1